MPRIYKITNTINDKSYVGVTKTSLEKRMSSHKAEANMGNKKDLYSDMRLYGIINFSYELLEECEEEIMFERERFYIQKFKTIIPDGYNATDGGSKGNKQSESSSEKKSKFHTKRWKSVNKKEFSEKMKQMFSKKENKEAHRIGLIKSWDESRREHFRELYQNNSNFQNAKGYLKSKELCSKAIQIYNSETKEVMEFKSVSDCAKHFGWSIGGVSKQLKKKCFLFQKYLVKFSTDDVSFDEMVVNANAAIDLKRQKMSDAKKGKSPWNKRRVNLSEHQ